MVFRIASPKEGLTGQGILPGILAEIQK